MPWEHCDQRVPDDAPCPGCGITKDQWTVEFNVTRTFKLTVQRTVRLALVDPAGEPMPREPYHVELPGGQVVTGELNDEGTASVRCPQEGDCLVAWPLRRQAEVRHVPSDEEDEGAPAGAAEDAGGEGEDAPAEAAEDAGGEGEDAEGGEDGDGEVHVVRRGDDPEALAHEHGFGSWAELYEHPRNAHLRERRDPDVLYVHDEVYIPGGRRPAAGAVAADAEDDDGHARDEDDGAAAQFDSLPVGRRLRFQLVDHHCDSAGDAGVSAGPLKLRLVDDEDHPQAGEPYRVVWPDGHLVEGELDDAGKATVPGRGVGAPRVVFPHRGPQEVEALTPRAYDAWGDPEREVQRIEAVDRAPGDDEADDEAGEGGREEGGREEGDEDTEGHGDDDDDDDEHSSVFDVEEGSTHHFVTHVDQCDVDAHEHETPEEAPPAEYRCAETDSVVVHAALRRAVEDARALLGAPDTLPVAGGVCPTPPALCHADLRGYHDAAGNALHITGLDDVHITRDAHDAGALIRAAELAGLWGVELSGEAEARVAERLRRKALHNNGAAQAANSTIWPAAVKRLPTSAPWQHLSVVPMSETRRSESDIQSATRHIHLHRTPSGEQRIVRAYVDGDLWRCFPLEVAALSGTSYTLHKTSWWMASYHRQWGRHHLVAWLVGLCRFYRARTGESLGVGDLSHVVGEDQTDHNSHERGVDVDLYVLRSSDADPAAGDWPEAYWITDQDDPVVQRSRPPAGPPDASALPFPAYSRGGTRVNDEDAEEVMERYGTILAYCLLTKPAVELVLWEGVHTAASRERASRIAREALAETGEAASWRIDPYSGQPFTWLVTAESDIGWGGISRPTEPPHNDHVHVRLKESV